MRFYRLASIVIGSLAIALGALITLLGGMGILSDNKSPNLSCYDTYDPTKLNDMVDPESFQIHRLVLPLGGSSCEWELRDGSTYKTRTSWKSTVVFSSGILILSIGTFVVATRRARLASNFPHESG